MLLRTQVPYGHVMLFFQEGQVQICWRYVGFRLSSVGLRTLIPTFEAEMHQIATEPNNGVDQCT